MKLPLFPLNTVLFPGMPLSLHIFEDRYKEMISRCLQESKPFGVVLIKEGVEALGPLAQPYSIGCTAQITQVQPLDEGRMNLIAIGHERFKLLSLDYALPYLMGDIETFPMFIREPAQFAAMVRRIVGQVNRYLTILAEIEQLAFEIDEIPTEPLPVAHLAAYLLQISAQEKHALLSIEHADDFAATLQQTYRHEITVLKAMIAYGKKPLDEPFSRN
jgi:uncharacterized protein